MMSKSSRKGRNFVSVPSTISNNVVRLRPVANTPAHLRTDFSMEDADIRTLVQNVLHFKGIVDQARTFLHAAVKEGHIGEHEANALFAILNQERDETT